MQVGEHQDFTPGFRGSLAHFGVQVDALIESLLNDFGVLDELIIVLCVFDRVVSKVNSVGLFKSE